MFLFKQKKYPENFAFLILTVFELFTRKFAKCLFTDIQKQQKNTNFTGE